MNRSTFNVRCSMFDVHLKPLKLPRLKASMRAWGMAVSLATLCLASTGCFNVSRETVALRNGLVESVGAECEAEIEVGIGAMTWDLARAGLGLLELDADVQAALSAVRGGDVGIYHVRPGEKPLQHAQMLGSADKAMSARGWDRVVSVVNRRELVAIYSSHETDFGQDVRFCVAVLDGRKLIVVSARGNLEPLLDLAFRQKGRLRNGLPVNRLAERGL